MKHSQFADIAFDNMTDNVIDHLLKNETLCICLETFGSEYESAEGGYYVETSTIEFLDEISVKSLDDVYEALIEFDKVVERYIDGTCSTSTITDFRDCFEFAGDPDDGVLYGPFARFDETEYVGSGFAVMLSPTKPEPKTYDGYE